MKYRQVYFAAICVCALVPAASAQIYKYVDPATGAVEYTNQPRKGAKAMNLDGTLSEIPTGNRRNSNAPRAVSVSSAPNANSARPAASVDASTQRTRDGTRSKILAEELATEERSLQEIRLQMNNGRPLPLADETVGSPKYIDRVKQLEKSQRHHERNIAALRKEIELARL